jgi:hypothetical protein
MVALLKSRTIICGISDSVLGWLMACTLTVDDVTGFTTGGALTTIVVSGTAVNCKSVTVEITCNTEHDLLTGVPVDTSISPGEWTATFTPVPETCRCSGKIEVSVKCDDGAEFCSADDAFELKCEPEDGECPSISLTGIDIGVCNPDGTRTFTITADLNSPSSYSAELRDSLATLLGTVSGSGMLTLSGSGDYAGSETFNIVVTSPMGCPGMTLPLTGPPCLTCPDINLNHEIGGCDDDGNRIVTLTATLNSTDPYTAELRDAIDTVLDSVSGTGTQILSHTETIAGATSKFFKVIVTSPVTCGIVETEIDVPPCVCPEIELSAAVGEECNPEGARNVAVTATLNSPNSYTAELRDSIATVLDTVSGNGTQILAHSAFYPGGSTQTFTVVITSPALCDGSEREVDVPACPGTTPPDEDEDDESSGCGGLRLVVAIAAALAILAALLAMCLPPAATALFTIAGVFAVIAAIGGFIYAIFCPNKPCKVGLLITGQSSLAAGVSAIVLSACCPWLIWAGLGLAAVGIATLLLWKSQCNKSTCALAKEVTKVIGGVVLPVLGILIFVPLVGACLSGVALAWVSATFGPIAAYASSC